MPDKQEKGTVEFDHVSFAYPEAGENVINDITFKAEKGQTVAIIGSTGSGKSTLVNLIPRFYDVSSGAIYLDGGMQPAKAFIDRFILSDLEDKRLFYDSKSNLQELIQGKLKKEFEYRLLEESGPEHDKTFVVEIDMEGECLGRGQGRTKKAAEQQAAYEALLLLRDRGYVFKKY